MISIAVFAATALVCHDVKSTYIHGGCCETDDFATEIPASALSATIGGCADALETTPLGVYPPQGSPVTWTGIGEYSPWRVKVVTDPSFVRHTMPFLEQCGALRYFASHALKGLWGFPAKEYFEANSSPTVTFASELEKWYAAKSAPTVQETAAYDFFRGMSLMLKFEGEGGLWEVGTHYLTDLYLNDTVVGVPSSLTPLWPKAFRNFEILTSDPDYVISIRATGCTYENLYGSFSRFILYHPMGGVAQAKKTGFHKDFAEFTKDPVAFSKVPGKSMVRLYNANPIMPSAQLLADVPSVAQMQQWIDVPFDGPSHKFSCNVLNYIHLNAVDTLYKKLMSSSPCDFPEAGHMSWNQSASAVWHVTSGSNMDATMPYNGGTGSTVSSWSTALLSTDERSMLTLYLERIGCELMTKFESKCPNFGKSWPRWAPLEEDKSWDFLETSGAAAICARAAWHRGHLNMADRPTRGSLRFWKIETANYPDALEFSPPPPMPPATGAAPTPPPPNEPGKY